MVLGHFCAREAFKVSFAKASIPWQVKLGCVNNENGKIFIKKYTCSKANMLAFKQANLWKKYVPGVTGLYVPLKLLKSANSRL